jgi:hypothetical protein
MSNLRFSPNKKSKLHQGFYCPKNKEKYKGKTLPFMRSQWETKFAQFLDNSPNVLEWISEKPEIPYLNPLTGTMWKYHPDFLCKIKDSSGTRIELIEIKPKHETEPPIVTEKKRRKTLREQQERWILNSAKWEAARAYCRAHKWNFKVIYLEGSSFKEAKKQNLTELLR